MRLRVIALAVLALGSLAASARAQPWGTSPPPISGAASELGLFTHERIAAPKKALELEVGTAYTQGFGMLRGGVGMPTVVSPGIAVDLGAAYRLNPHLAFGATGQFYELEPERAIGARGVTMGLAAAYHFRPYVRSDPWIQVGTGYRMLWETHAPPTPNLLSHGFELAKVTAGVDLRFNADTAVSPVIGADLDVFLWQDAASSVAIPDPRLSTFVFIGLQGRIDLTGSHEPSVAP